MLLKNHLIEVFKKASSENNTLLKENIVLKWVHRFGIDSLNDLLIHTPALMAYQLEEENQEQTTLMDEVDEEENQEQTTLMDEVDEEENQEQIKLESSKTFENIEETKWESNLLETSSSNEIFSKEQNSNNIKQLTDIHKLPLPYIKNLRKWINNDKKAS
ncbi:glycoprotein [Prochlorococcus sp. AH-716-I09]|nr:glycoprotein [Prochlorococcus sp. AH-716-I09]